MLPGHYLLLFSVLQPFEGGGKGGVWVQSFLNPANCHAFQMAYFAWPLWGRRKEHIKALLRHLFIHSHIHSFIHLFSSYWTLTVKQTLWEAINMSNKTGNVSVPKEFGGRGIHPAQIDTQIQYKPLSDSEKTVRGQWGRVWRIGKYGCGVRPVAKEHLREASASKRSVALVQVEAGRVGLGTGSQPSSTQASPTLLGKDAQKPTLSSTLGYSELTDSYFNYYFINRLSLHI